MTYLLYQHSQYTAFYRPNKTEVMIITPWKSVTMGDLKMSKTDVKRAVVGQRSKKTEENKHSSVILAVVLKVKHCIVTKVEV